MNIENIRALAEILTKNGLSRLEVTEDGITVRMEKTAVFAGIPPSLPAAQIPAASASAEGNAFLGNATKPEEPFAGETVVSPIVGIFYAAPDPGSSPFVAIGSRVKKGDVLCIVEAMKQMNEIVAESDGEIADICAKDGELVEFGQPLFRLLGVS